MKVMLFEPRMLDIPGGDHVVIPRFEPVRRTPAGEAVPHVHTDTYPIHRVVAAKPDGSRQEAMFAIADPLVNEAFVEANRRYTEGMRLSAESSGMRQERDFYKRRSIWWMRGAVLTAALAVALNLWKVLW